jgi:hypothetical protein
MRYAVLAMLVLCVGAAETPPPDEEIAAELSPSWNLSYAREVGQRAKERYSAEMVASAANSPKGVTRIVVETQAVILSSKNMLIDALKKTESREAKCAILQGLTEFELDDEEMALVARDLGFLHPRIQDLGGKASPGSRQPPSALGWLARRERRNTFQAYPASEVLRRQGTRAVPVVRRALVALSGESDAFSVGCRVLMALCSPSDNRGWANGTGSALSPAQRDRFLSLLSEHECEPKSEKQ